MYDEIISLIAEEKSADKYGDITVIQTSRNVFADLKSITRSEFYQAQAAGMKPEVKFVLADYLDYRNEEIVRYQPFGGVEEDYSVIRTYRNGNQLELICKRGVET